MSKYTTGDIAALCGVTVRTVQYYDTRGILTPSALSEGGRRLYSEDDRKKLRIICFLRDLGLPIDAIGQLLSEEDPGSVIFLLLEQQQRALQEELDERQGKLQKLETLKRELRDIEHFSVESIGDVAKRMENRNKMKKLHILMLATGLPVTALQWVAVILWITRGIWWLFVVWAVIAAVWGTWISRYYFKKVAYICPQCHEVFKPSFREAMWARHTPRTRRLTCTCCGHKGFCVETWGGDEA